MGNRAQNEVAVGTIDIVQADVLIPDSDILPLPNQIFEKGHRGALAQVIGVLLEGETDDADPRGVEVHHGLNSSLEMALIASEGVHEQGKFQIQPGCAML